MRIAGFELDRVEVTPWADWYFVHVLTDEGLRGLGELTPGASAAGTLAALWQLEEALRGQDPGTIEQIVHRHGTPDRSRDQIAALSGVEQALWDLCGKRLDTPVHVLLGGACRDEIPLYANINRISRIAEVRTPDWFADNAKAAVAAGFSAVKLAPFDGMPMDLDRAAAGQLGIDCMRTVREAIGPDIDLMVDVHSHFTERGALELADELRDLDLYWFEQPTPESDLDACLRVKEGCGMTVAGGEQRMLRHGFVEVLERPVMDVIMPDVTVIGGIGELKKTAAMAAAHGIVTSPHGPFGPVMIAAGAQAMMAHPEFSILEFGWGETAWRQDLVVPPEDVSGGKLRVSRTAPGLGVELNRDVVEEHRAGEW